MREAAAWLTKPIMLMNQASSTVVNTSKKASAHMCTTAQRQKSAMTKLVVGFATKADRNSRTIEATAYSIHLGSTQASDSRQFGRTARATIAAHSTKTANISTCHALPSSTNSQPWLPQMFHDPPKCPRGPRKTPTSVPAASTTRLANSRLISATCPAGSLSLWLETTKIDAPIQHTEIQ